MKTRQFVTRYSAALLGMTLLLPAQAATNAGWTLMRNRDEVQVYLKEYSDSNVKAVKTVTRVGQPVSLVQRVLLNPLSRAQWQTYCDSEQLFKRLGPRSELWYGLYDPPWPVHNRDIVTKVSWTREPNGVVHIDAVAVAGQVPPKTGYMRITNSNSHWTLIPLASGGTYIEVASHSEPSSPVPAWLVNKFLVPAPFKSFQGLRTLLQQQANTQAAAGK